MGRDRPTGPPGPVTSAVLFVGLLAVVVVGGVGGAVGSGAGEGSVAVTGVDSVAAADSPIEVQWNRSYEHGSTISTGQDPLSVSYPVLVADATQTADGTLAFAGTTSTWDDDMATTHREAIVLATDRDGNRRRLGLYGGTFPDGWLREVTCLRGAPPLGEQDPPYYSIGDSCGYGGVTPETDQARFADREVDERGHAVAATDDGGVVVAGETNTYGSGPRMENSPGNPWLVNLDAQGQEVWNHTYQAATDRPGSGATFTAVTRTDDGGYVAVGESASFDGGRQDLWILKVDARGAVQWSRGYGGKYDDRAFDVIQTANGNYAVTGTTFSYTIRDSPDAYNNVWLLVVDDEGEEVVNRTYTGAGESGPRSFETGHAIVEPSNGGFLIAGTTTAFTENAADDDAWLVRTDSSGDVRWNRTYGGPEEGNRRADTAMDVVETPDGGYLFAGETHTLTADQTSTWVVKTAGDGTEQWHETFEVGRVNTPTALAKTDNGDYVLGLNVRGHDDVLRGRVLKFADTTELSDDQRDDTDGDATGGATTSTTDADDPEGQSGFGFGHALLAVFFGLLGVRYRWSGPG